VKEELTRISSEDVEGEEATPVSTHISVKISVLKICSNKNEKPNRFNA
jgi:hypothetical protein